MAEIQRTKPFSVEAEQSVLGSVLIDPECITGLIEFVSSSDFYIPEHGEIFDAMCELFNKNRNIDVVTLINMLTEHGVYSPEECKKYVGVIADVVPSAANVRDYARSRLRILANLVQLVERFNKRFPYRNEILRIGRS